MVIFGRRLLIVLKTLTKDLHEEIKELKREIVRQEHLVNQAIVQGKSDDVKRGLERIDSNIKYLSIISNGVPIDKQEDNEIRKFLIKHFQIKRNLTVFASM